MKSYFEILNEAVSKVTLPKLPKGAKPLTKVSDTKKYLKSML